MVYLIKGRNLSPAVIDRTLSCFCDFPCLDTIGAGQNPLYRFTDQGANSLKIRLEAPLAFVIRMADQITDLMPFAANLTYSCHDPEILSVSCISLIKKRPHAIMNTSNWQEKKRFAS